MGMRLAFFAKGGQAGEGVGFQASGMVGSLFFGEPGVALFLPRRPPCRTPYGRALSKSTRRSLQEAVRGADR